MKNIGLGIRWIKGVPLYKKSIFSHNSNKNTSIPLRFHFRKNSWFSTKLFGNFQDSFQIFNGLILPIFHDFPWKIIKKYNFKKSKTMEIWCQKFFWIPFRKSFSKSKSKFHDQKNRFFQGKLRKKLTKKTGQPFGDTHDGDLYKFSECIKNDRKALELWGFGFWNFTCMKDHWRFPNYKFKTFSKIGISHLKEIWPHIWADVVETSRFSTKFNDFVKIMKINDWKNDQLFEKIFKEFSEKSFDFLSNFFS